MKSIIETVAHAATAIACIVVVGAFVPQLKDRWSGGSAASVDQPRVQSIDNLRLRLPQTATRGSQQAKIAFIEFSDFQCPYCGRFARETGVDFQKEFVDSGKALYVFRNFPLTPIHPLAPIAGKAVLCAGEQNRFWPMHERLFANQAALNVEDLLSRARQLELDERRFTNCLNGDEVAERLREDITEGRRAGVSGTPTFFLGTVQPDGSIVVRARINGTQTIDVLRGAVNSLLRSAS